jgi:hypothetical protein
LTLRYPSWRQGFFAVYAQPVGAAREGAVAEAA